MSKTFLSTLAASGLAVLLAGCGGQGRDDTLVDGAVDRPTDSDSAASAQDIGPPSMSSAAAGPATGRVPDAQAAGAGGAGPGQAATAGATLSLATQGSHGPHVALGGGGALYRLEGDRDGSKCTADCLAAWPPVLVAGVQPSGGPGLQGAMIASIARPDGNRQVTYNGQPLYRYAADTGVGAVQGHGVTDRWGTWHLVSPEGTAVGSRPAMR